MIEEIESGLVVTIVKPSFPIFYLPSNLFTAKSAAVQHYKNTIRGR